MTHRTWAEVWEARRLDPARPSVLSRLLAADGMDTEFGSVPEDAWNRYVLETAQTIGIKPGSSVFEVGCGAGAWLYEVGGLGCEIAGLDGSSALIGYARQHLPRGTWLVGDAASLDPIPQYDFVVSSGVFLYFPSLDYARGVLEQMVRKARAGVLILDVPDISKQEAALALRRQVAGEKDYSRRYDGLDHLYFEKAWFQSVLESNGALRVKIEDQHIDGYLNSGHRFNVYGWPR